MTLAELRESTRRALRDTGVADTYWSDDDLDEYLVEAQEELVMQTHCLIDSVSSFCTVNLVAATRSYSLSPLVLEIDEVQPSWQDEPLTNAHSYKSFTAGWRSATGYPENYATDFTTQYLTLDSALEAVTTEALYLTVRRLPVVMTATQGPEIPLHYQRKLKHYALWRAFSVQDAEVNNAKKAADELKIWNNALDEINQAEKAIRPEVYISKGEW